MNFDEFVEKEVNKEIFKQILIIVFILVFVMAGVISYAYFNKAKTFSVKETEYKNTYELGDKSWFVLDKENKYYIFQPIELGDWDYTLRNEDELKRVIETYFINKYNISTENAIKEVNNIFENIK